MCGNLRKIVLCWKGSVLHGGRPLWLLVVRVSVKLSIRGSVCFVLAIVVTCGKSFREVVYVDT
jgi:hypothetical protein